MWGIFFHYKRAPETKFAAKNFEIIFVDIHYVQFQAFQNNELISPNQEVGKQEKK